MAWIFALIHYFFPDTARGMMLHAAYRGARVILDVLVNPRTGAINHDTAEGRRMAAQQLHNSALALFLALDERAREIAGLPPRRPRRSEIRLAEPTRRDVSAYTLVNRARQIIDQLRRFEHLARRRALKLQRNAARRETLLNTTTLTIFVLLLLAVVMLNAEDTPRIETTPATFSDARIRAPP